MCQYEFVIGLLKEFMEETGWGRESTYLRIICISPRALRSRHANLTAFPVETTTLRIFRLRLWSRECENLSTGMLADCDDQGRWVGGDHAGEYTGVDHEDVICSVYLGVGIDNSAPALQPTVCAHLAGSHPVVGAAGANVTEV